MGELNLENILEGDSIDDLFSDEVQEEPVKEEKETQEKEEPAKEEEYATEVSVDDLFNEPESVGGKHEEKRDTTPEGDGSPKNQSVYSSIAVALKDDGVLSDLEYDYEGVDSAEKFSELIDKEVESRLADAEKRINAALNAGVQPDIVQRYEGAIKYLNNITEEMITEESEDGEKLRREILYYDLINRGDNAERAKRRVERMIENGTDLEEAKDALESNREFYRNEYEKLIQEGKEAEKRAKTDAEKRVKNFEKSVMEDELLGGVELDKNTRKKVFDNVMKPSWRDPETEQYLTPLQKYQKENPDEFLKIVGVLYTTTNGFKDIGPLVGAKANKAVKKSLRDLENKLSNTRRDGDGNLMFVSNDTANETFSGIKLDI